MTATGNAQRQCFYGDWLRSASRLHATGEEAQFAIAQALQLGWIQPVKAVLPAPLTNKAADDPIQSIRSETRSLLEDIDAPLHPEPREHEPAEPEVFLSQAASHEDVTVERLLTAWDQEDAEPLAPTDAALEETGRRTQLIPLPRLRGMLPALVATRLPSAVVDEAAVLRKLERGELVETITFRQMAHAGNGLHVLLDRQESMQPYLRDQDDLATALVRLLGSPLCEVFEFRGDPGVSKFGAEMGGSATSRGRTTPYSPPSIPQSILLVSDFGLGPGPSRWDVDPDWPLALARRARRRQCSVLALSPVPRCPPSWSRELTWLPWDRSLTIGAVLKAIGREPAR